MTRLISSLILLTISMAATAANLPQHSPTPGGIALVELGELSSPRPEVTYNKNKVMVLSNATQWVAVVGVPLSAKPGKHRIKVSSASKSMTKTFNVLDKKYETQHLTIKNKRKVDPNEQDMIRIRKESKRIASALKHWSDQDDVTIEFVPPVNGRMSSSFGLRRFFNEQPRKPHSGMDIAATEGTPIVAPAPGKVIETGDFFFNGKSVFVDHGQGLVTMYGHMNSIEVKPGQLVKTGSALGTVGMTGRVTGPHLHWGISLNNARVDPRLFLKPEGAQ